jgi:hypothetical protein
MMTKLLSLHKALNILSLMNAAFPRTKSLLIAGRPTHKHTKALLAETCANQHLSLFLHIAAHGAHRVRLQT